MLSEASVKVPPPEYEVSSEPLHEQLPEPLPDDHVPVGLRVKFTVSL